MTKKKSTKTTKHISHNKTHILLRKGLVVYAMIVFIAFVMISLSALALVSAKHTYTVYERENRIAAIYNGLNLDDSYQVDYANVFGEKRAYPWDSSRTMASSVSYGRNAGRDATFADINTRIVNAGFEQIEGPNYGEVARQDHYTNEFGEFIRVSIETRAQRDASVYGTEAPSPDSIAADKNGPVYVTIRVNLDDNNE